MDTSSVGGDHGIAMRFRVVSSAAPGRAGGAPADAGCRGCSRRTVLRGIAVSAAGAIVGCAPGDPMQLDAGVPAPLCGESLCIDLAAPQNTALTAVDGSLIVAAPHDNIIIVRTSATAALAVSDICTHAGCGVSYDRTSRIFVCPCHGSRYSLAGAVLSGPASRPLARYTTQLDPSANQLTILL
jgi:nitrite reductase/ring-hydroxylating ferredoxin subunit